MDFIFDFFEDMAREGIGMIILIIVLSIIVFIGLVFLFRAITCWYIKTGKILKELKKTNSYLERIAIAVEQNRVMVPQQPVSAPTPVVEPTPVVAPAPVAEPTPVVAPAPVAEPTPVVAPVAVEAPAFAASAPVAAPERKCASCGSTLKEVALFCVNCGAKAEPDA